MAGKHIPVSEMLKNKDFDASDIANYALYNMDDNDSTFTVNVEDLINTLLNKERQNMASDDLIKDSIYQATKWESILTENQRSNMPMNQARDEVVDDIFTKLINK